MIQIITIWRGKKKPYKKYIRYLILQHNLSLYILSHHASHSIIYIIPTTYKTFYLIRYFILPHISYYDESYFIGLLSILSYQISNLTIYYISLLILSHKSIRYLIILDISSDNISHLNTYLI